MAPLIRNMHRHEAQWVKLKGSYMWGNKMYYLRRTKFAVYQLATTPTNIVNGLGMHQLIKYNELPKNGIPVFPDARFDASDFIGSLAFNTFSCIFLSLFFGAALFFDLFWPEREEAPCVQWAWKLGAAAASTFQMIASIATTIIVATHGVHIHGVSVVEKSVIIGNWEGRPLVYRLDKLAVAAVLFGWIVEIFTVWSTVLMWRCYAHNNKYGPFADHVSKRPSGGTLSMETELREV